MLSKKIICFIIAAVLVLNNVDCWGKVNTSFQDDRVVTWHYGNSIHPGNKSIYFDLKFFAPTQPGTYPVILFLTGLDGFAEAFLYTEFCTKLTYTTESIVVAIDTIRYPSMPDKEENLFAQTIDWILEHANDLIQVTKMLSVL